MLSRVFAVALTSSLSVCLCLAQQPPWVTQTFPVATSSAFEPAVRQYVSTAISSSPIARGNSIYLSRDGDDLTGDGSRAKPFKSLQKISQVLATKPENLTIFFRNGDSFYSDAGIAITSPHITLTSYGDGPAAFAAKPRISRFSPPLQWYQWTDAGNNVFWTPVSGDVAWVRQQNDNLTVFRRTTSLTDCTSIQGSWYCDSASGRLYVHAFGNVSLRDGDARYQYVLKNRDEGIIIQDVDDVRVDSLAIEGYGAGTPRDLSYPGYGIDCRISGSQRNVVTNCDVFYNGRHNITKGTGSGYYGGSLVVANCNFGATVNDGINVVSYAPNGGQELLALHNTYYSAALPTAYNSFLYGGSSSCPTYVHSGGGTNYSSLMISLDEQIIPGQFQLALLPSVGDMAPISNISQCRAFVIGLDARCRYPTVEDQLATGANGFLNYGLGSPNAAFINCNIEVRNLWCKYGGVRPLLTSASGYWINSRILFDFSYCGDPYKWASFVDGVSSYGSNMSLFTAQFYFCDFDFRYSGSAATVGFSSNMLVSGSAGYNNLAASWQGCLKACRIICQRPGNGEFRLGFGNNGTSLLGNQYPETAAFEGAWGFSTDPWALPPSISSVDGAPPKLLGQVTIDGYLLEYDRRRVPRSLNQTVGTLEYN